MLAAEPFSFPCAMDTPGEYERKAIISIIERATVQTADAALSRPPSGTERTLLVDDEESVVMVARDLFLALGYRP
ncbi:MAG: hypothetical protein ACYDBT_12780 [Desulfobulbaceae bacterium]